MAPTLTQSAKLIKELACPRIKEYIKLDNSFTTETKSDDWVQLQELEKKNPNAFHTKFYSKLLASNCEKLGLKSIFNQMSHAQLNTLYTDFKKDESEKKLNKTALAKILAREICINIVQYFDDLVPQEVEVLAQYLDSVPTKGQIKGEACAEEIRMMGVEIFLYDLPSDLLVKQLEESGYDIEKFPVRNPNDYVYTLLTGEYPKKKKAAKPVEVLFVQKKPSLSKVGNRYHDIFQHYNLNELQDFVRQEGMKISGTKNDLVKRILRYVNEGVKEIPKERIAKKEEEEEEVEEEEVEEEEEAEAEEEDVEYVLQPTPDPIPEKSPSVKKSIKPVNTVVGKSPKKSTPSKK